jgi:hypothetical protein
MLAADVVAFGAQQIAQHPRTRERVLQVQLVNAAQLQSASLTGAAGSIRCRG